MTTAVTSYDDLAVMEFQAEIDRLKLSNVKLIAELGMIAEALGAEPNMKSVLDRIELLKKYAAPDRDAIDL